MATSKTRRARPLRAVVGLVIIIVVVFGSLFAGTKFDSRTDKNPSGAGWTPGLALDLEGGTQVILAPVAQDGAKVTSDTIDQAISVIRQRIDSSGVAEAEITSQGQGNIVVGIPGKVTPEMLDLVKTSAKMEFRPVLVVSAPQNTPKPSASPSAEASPGATDGTQPDSETTANPAPGAEASSTPSPSAETEPTPEQSPAPSPSASAAPRPENPSDLAQITPELQKEFEELDCTDPANLVGGVPGPRDAATVACAQDGTAKYILGPVEIEGTNISNATSGLGVGPNGISTNQWVVSLKFDSQGTDEFAQVTERLQPLPSPQNQFAIVLDGLVVSAPQTNAIIPNGEAEISGTFTQGSAATLARQLNFGALPLTFTVQSEEQISATLGTEQLQRGLLAGLIGLILVVIYSLFQYRALGLVTVASLIIAAVLTYGTISMLSWLQGYRLSLSGVAGLIVAIGITVDSFIVYFERIRDELRDGYSLPMSVERGWGRARRTILASDAVNFLAAVVLYLLAVGGVRGFAFTLGLTTLIDVLVVFMFTHPMLQILAKTRFFAEGHPLSGLDPRRLGAVPRYRGRGRIREPRATSSTSSASDDGAHMTIAERKAAQQSALESEASEATVVADTEEKH